MMLAALCTRSCRSSGNVAGVTGSLPREGASHTIVGLEGELSDAPLIAPKHPQQVKSLWRKRGIASFSLQLPRALGEEVFQSVTVELHRRPGCRASHARTATEACGR